MVIYLKVQSRKKPKLGGIFEVHELATFLATFVITPVSLWYLFGWQMPYIMAPGVAWVAWFVLFSLGKPAGYTGHLFNYLVRNKLYTTNLSRSTDPVFYAINPKIAPLPKKTADQLERLRQRTYVE